MIARADFWRLASRDAVGPPRSIAAPAKLNLTLAVLGRRPDGFHDLYSVFVPLAFGDEITILVLARGANWLWFGTSGKVPVGDNLVLRADIAARAAVSRTYPDKRLAPLAIRVRKRIPVASGLGGGSSDAASTLLAALEAWDVELPHEQLSELGASLGSDVPFCLARCAAVVTGRGEHVEPLPPFRGVAPAALLVTPRLAVSTAAVFAAYAAGARPSGAAARQAGERLAGAMSKGMSAEALLERAEELAAANDLLPATLRVAPELAAFRRALGELLGRPIGQSGSGPTAWILYPSLAGARRAATAVRAAARTGQLPAVGEGQPFVVATTIAA